MFCMSQKFDELKQKLKNVDKDQAKHVFQEIQQARQDGKIDENEKSELLNSAKGLLGGSDLGGGLGGLFGGDKK